MLASRDNFPLLDDLLAEQQRLDTPVARFSAAHESGSFEARVSRHASLIPLTAPLPGEQYAFEVDLDSCTGCKSCVAACHSLNGLDENETWRDVGLLVSSSRARPFTQTVTTACHHCADPACLNGCPVLAYEKNPITGVVVHLDDQCIGCSYCVLKCPYDVPKFSERLGIVRKCDMCHGRLAEGEAPACVQSCPTEAIRIVNVVTAERPSPISGSDFLPGAPEPKYTRPTTRYVTKRAWPENIVAADAKTPRPQPPHWPLAIMLTLLPLAVALSVLAAMPRFASGRFALGAVAAGAVGLGASVFHLGQPSRAWRIFLGWRRSWLSREATVFGVWFPLTLGTLLWPGLAPAAVAVGLVGLACSVMIYVDTRRTFWRLSQTAPRFFGTGVVFALALVVPLAAAFALLAKLAWESRTFFDRSASARLQRGPLARATLWRDLLGLSAVLLLVSLPGWPACALLMAGELLERHLFFRAVDAPKMPGMPA
ncbi:MAG TPA: DmsC/YnfH family molybdoenzyme membrane anchor subunit [Opitutaceae bacterium]|nr:DmsC/YnfH family molybdoenzyme membrane anchor subunit [Opitutaceae bacterium]